MREGSPKFWQILLSVVAALFGVQSESASKRDFTNGAHPALYILVGIVMVALLMASLWTIVKAVLA
jgi:Protein of unknown function (DUF2970)